MLLRSHGGGNCSGDGGAHEGGPDLHPTASISDWFTFIGNNFFLSATGPSNQRTSPWEIGINTFFKLHAQLTSEGRLRGHKTFFMLNSTGHEISIAQKN